MEHGELTEDNFVCVCVAVGDPGVRSTPSVRERCGEGVLWVLGVVRVGESGPAAHRLLQDALCRSADGALHLCMNTHTHAMHNISQYMIH